MLFSFRGSGGGTGATLAFAVLLLSGGAGTRFTVVVGASSSDGAGLVVELPDQAAPTSDMGGGRASSLRALLASVSVPDANEQTRLHDGASSLPDFHRDVNKGGSRHRSSGLRRGLEPALDENEAFKIAKSTKGYPKEVCYKTALVYALEGPNENPIVGTTGGKCLTEYQALGTACTPATGATQSTRQSKSDDYLKCMEDGGFRLDNWWFDRDVTGTYQITSGPTTDVGDGSFRAMISTAGVANLAAAAEKVELEYSNFELKDTNVGLLTKIAFDYYIESAAQCGLAGTCSLGPANCATENGGPQTAKAVNKIFVNIYTRAAAANTNFYDCRYDFTLGISDVLPANGALNTWHSFSFNPLTKVGDGANKSGGSSVVTCPATFAAAAAAKYVLGYGSLPPGTPEECSPLAAATSIKISVGDGSCVDSGMVVSLGNIQIEYPYADESGAHVYNFYGK